jgi:hypothetical protein
MMHRSTGVANPEERSPQRRMFRWPGGNCADVIPELADGVVPDILTDQTSAHDPLNGYVPPWDVAF